MLFKIGLNEDFRIKVGAHYYNVKFVEPDHKELQGDHGSLVYAMYTIFINKDDPATIKVSTLLHELIHVMESLYDVRISHRDLNLVADSMAQVLLDNFKIEDDNENKNGKEIQNINNDQSRCVGTGQEVVPSTGNDVL